jgi:hypothetical protein
LWNLLKKFILYPKDESDKFRAYYISAALKKSILADRIKLPNNGNPRRLFAFKPILSSLM